MKTYIVGVALVVLMILFNSFQVEHDTYFRAQNRVKEVCDDAAGAGALIYEADAYGTGVRVYDKAGAEAIIKTLIMKNMHLKADATPEADAFWVDKIKYATYYIDDSHALTVYKNGQYVRSSAFSYHSIFTEPDTGYEKLITEPTVIVTIEAQYPVRGASWMRWPAIIRSSAYEDYDRN